MTRKPKPNSEQTIDPQEQNVLARVGEALKKNLGGRPRKEVDYEILKDLCHIQCTGEECAGILRMSYESLNNKLSQEGHDGFLEFFKKFSIGGKASLRRLQWAKAMDGDKTMMIFLGKQSLGQSDRHTTELTGAKGGPIKTENTEMVVDWGQVTDKQLAVLDEIRVSQEERVM